MAHQEAVRIGNSAALTAHTGTAGTAEMVRLVGTEAGALTVDLVSGDTITVSVGTINAGTINTLKDGTITEVQKGSIAVTAGTGIVTNGSIAVTAGTGIVTGGSIQVTAGTMADVTITTLPNLPGGTVDEVSNIAGGTIETTGNWTAYTGTIEIPASDTVQSGTQAVTVDGEIHAVTLVTPDMEDTDQTNLRLIDALGGTLVDTGAQAESAITSYGTIMPMNTTMEWVAYAAGTQSVAKNIIFSVHYKK